MLRPVTLVLGGAASGKSVFAESLITAGFGILGNGATYLATATAGDDEMKIKIQRHRARRGEHWTTVEEPISLTAALARHTHANRPVLVDCLTLWLSNLLLANKDPELEISALVSSLATLRGPTVLVSNEVGDGIVPENALARHFRNEAGRMNQRIAAAADRVYLVTAGLPQLLKETNT